MGNRTTSRRKNIFGARANKRAWDVSLSQQQAIVHVVPKIVGSWAPVWDGATEAHEPLAFVHLASGAHQVHRLQPQRAQTERLGVCDGVAQQKAPDPAPAQSRRYRQTHQFRHLRVGD